LLSAGLAVSSVGSLAIALTKVPLPEKFTWSVGLGSVAVYGLCNFFYSLGGRWLLLLPIIYWLPIIMYTTGALALSISCYSTVNRANISAHWYSLPTGFSFTAVLINYIPAYYLSTAYAACFVAWQMTSSSVFRTTKETQLLLALGLFAASPWLFNLRRLDFISLGFLS